MSKWNEDYFWHCYRCGAVSPKLDIEESELQLFDDMCATHKNCGGNVDVISPARWGYFPVHTLTELAAMPNEEREKEVKEIMSKAKQIAQDYAELRTRREAYLAKCCPNCGADPRLHEQISTLRRAFSVATWGLASNKIGKTKRCKRCGHMW